MAKTSTKAAKPVNLTDEEEIALVEAKPRLAKLIIKNFRCIGPEAVDIDLNDIVILVGPNNAGKSSILKAYELIMADGSKKSLLDLDDFPNREVDPENLPTVEIHTIIIKERVGKHWIKELPNGELLIRERWVWPGPGQGPKREGFNVEEDRWVDNVPFGFASVANLRRPEPHSVLAFDNPDVQAKAIGDLLIAAINQRVSNLQADNGEEKNDYYTLLDKIRDLQTKIVDESQEQIEIANRELTTLISKVFPKYEVDFEVSHDTNLDKSLILFKSVDAKLMMGPADGYKSSLAKQGSGARRTLLWTALKFLSESNRPTVQEGKQERPHLLLLDEPEICLHPNAIREASNVLYNLPKGSNWQVMATTHSPIFINFEQDNTTIIRVEKNENGIVKGTTIFRPDRSKLGADDIENLKLLNLCDPYVAEFFFGGKVIIVEGDTEYTAFNYLKNLNPDKYSNVNVIRARGKATIVSLIKILNHFGADYSILHDSDQPYTKAGKGNPAWGNNPNIIQELKNRPEGVKVRLLASLPNFEEAYFFEEIKKDKPYNALKTIRDNPDKLEVITQLFDALIDHGSPTPKNCAEWDEVEKLHEALAAVIVLNPKIAE